MQTLSSKYTFFYKYIFILIWICGFGAGAREVLFINPQFGRKISFMPSHRRARSTGKHPLVVELRKEFHVAGQDG